MKTTPLPAHPGTCPDCQHASGSQTLAEHCQACGAKLKASPLGLAELSGDLLGMLVSLELPLLRTTRDLLRSPGATTNAWIAGRRKSYVSPVKFLVIIGILVALTFDPLINLQQASGTGVVYEAGVAKDASQYIALLCIGLLVPVAIALHFASRLLGLRRRWLEWYALCLYCMGVAVAGQLVMSLGEVLMEESAVKNGLRIIQGVLPLITITWGAMTFFGSGRRLRALAAALLGLVSAILAVAIVQYLWSL